MLEQYFELREIFLERYMELNLKEQKVHLISLLNDTALLIRADLIEITENLPLYKLGLKTGIIFHNGLISNNTYRTIIAVSNYNKSFEFTHNVIDLYTAKLEKTIQEDAYYWAIAHTAYWERKLSDALDTLIKNEFKNPYFQLHSKMLTTQVYFDLFLEDDSYQFYLFDYFNSFEKWISREKIGSDFFKKSYLKFVQKCRALAKLFANHELSINNIDQLFENELNVQGIRWLFLKRDELTKSKK